MTDRQLEALLKIRNYPDLVGFKEILRELTDKHLAVLVGAVDDRQMVQAQGAYRAFQSLQELIEDAERLLGKRAAVRGTTPVSGF